MLETIKTPFGDFSVNDEIVVTRMTGETGVRPDQVITGVITNLRTVGYYSYIAIADKATGNPIIELPTRDIVNIKKVTETTPEEPVAAAAKSGTYNRLNK